MHSKIQSSPDFPSNLEVTDGIRRKTYIPQRFIITEAQKISHLEQRSNLESYLVNTSRTVTSEPSLERNRCSWDVSK